jgi:methyl-accepting chemotaxis protein
MAISLEQYLSSVRKFNESVSLLATTLQQVANARNEALKASAEVRKELDATDQHIEEVAALVRQQISPEILRKMPRSEPVPEMVEVRRAG